MRNIRTYVLGITTEMLLISELWVRGFTLLHHRYKNPIVEIDLICIKGMTLLFGEVKYRNSLDLIEDSVRYQSALAMYDASDVFISEYTQFENYDRLFKLFIVTREVIRVISVE